MKIYIVAGNMQEFKRYVQEKYEYYLKQAMLMPEYVYVGGPHTLMGLNEIEGFYIGTWKDRPDLQYIQNRIQLIKTKRQFDD